MCTYMHILHMQYKDLYAYNKNLMKKETINLKVMEEERREKNYLNYNIKKERGIFVLSVSIIHLHFK